MASAVINVKHLGSKLYLKTTALITGTGAIVNGDDLAVNVQQYPIGSEYIYGGKIAKRVAGAGVATDWVVVSGAAILAAQTDLTDNTGGVASNTLAVVATGTPADLAAQAAINTSIRNSLASIAAKVNAILG